MENTRRRGTLVYTDIFSRTLSVTGDSARQAMMCGMMPYSISRLMPSWAALDFCSPRVGGCEDVRQGDEDTEPSPSS